MKQSKQLIVSVVAGMGMFCGLYHADGQTVSQNLAPLGTVDNVVYGYTASSTRNANTFDEVTNANTNYALGFQKTFDSLGGLLWYTNLSTGSPTTSYTTNYIGFQSDNSTYSYYDSGNTSGNTLALNYPSPGFLSGGPQQADPYLLTTSGIVGGETARNFISATNTNTARGTDAWIYTPGTNALDGTTGFTGVYTPTVVNPQTTIADTNGDGITSSYFYSTASDTVNNVTGVIQAVNNASQAVGTSTRYTGLSTSTTSLGTDTWLSTQTGPTTVSTVLLGLGSGASTSGESGSSTIPAAYSYNNGFVVRTSSVIPFGTIANNRGLNDSGEAAGTTNRYDDDQVNVSNSSASAGTDSWVYVNSSTGTLQVGLTGAGSPYEVAAGGGLSANVPYRYSKVTALNPSGQIAGTSWAFNVSSPSFPNSGTTPTTTGWQAWVYTPSGTPGTSSAIGANGYVQVGLTDLATGSAIAHASTHALSSLPGSANQSSFSGTVYGTAANGYNLVQGLSNNGIAAGVAYRVDAAANTDLRSISGGLGADAWVNTTNVSPVALFAANSSSVSYYQPNVSNVLGPHTVPTVSSGTPGLPSNYVVGSDTAGLNPGYSIMSVVGMNATGMTVGTITRVTNVTSGSTVTGTNIGQDLWVYDPAKAEEFILAAPAASANDYGSISFQGITDSGNVFGTYITNANGPTSSTTGGYLFDWSESTGLITVDQLYTGTATAPTLQPLNNDLAGQTNAADLFANGLSLYNMFSDASGNLYLDGNTATTATGTGTAGISNGAFEVSVPEPTSATLVVAASAGLLLRRRRRMA